MYIPDVYQAWCEGKERLQVQIHRQPSNASIPVLDSPEPHRSNMYPLFSPLPCLSSPGAHPITPSAQQPARITGTRFPQPAKPIFSLLQSSYSRQLLPHLPQRLDPRCIHCLVSQATRHRMPLIRTALILQRLELRLVDIRIVSYDACTRVGQGMLVLSYIQRRQSMREICERVGWGA